MGRYFSYYGLLPNDVTVTACVFQSNQNIWKYLKLGKWGDFCVRVVKSGERKRNKFLSITECWIVEYIVSWLRCLGAIACYVGIVRDFYYYKKKKKIENTCKFNYFFFHFKITKIKKKRLNIQIYLFCEFKSKQL